MCSKWEEDDDYVFLLAHKSMKITITTYFAIGSMLCIFMWISNLLHSKPHWNYKGGDDCWDFENENKLETFRMQIKDLYDNEKNMCKDAQRRWVEIIISNNGLTRNVTIMMDGWCNHQVNINFSCEQKGKKLW